MGYKYIFLFFLLGIRFLTQAQTGIGTTTPVNKLEVVTSTAEPATSGSSSNGNLRLGGTSGNHILDFGLSSSSTYGWLQARSRSDYSTNYHFLLNPNGGRVGLGTFSPTSLLTVGNATGSNAGEITINPQATTNEGGQITFKKSLSGGTTDWTIDHYGDNNTNARFRIFSGGDETSGIILKENGFIGLGTTNPTARINVTNGGIKIHTGFSNSTTRPSLTGSTIGNYEIRGVGSITGTSQQDGGDDGFLRLSAGGGTNSTAQSSIDISGFSTQGDMDNNIVMRTRGSERLRINNEGRIGIGTTSPATTLQIENTNLFGTDPSSTTSPSLYILNSNNNSSIAHATALIRSAGNLGGNPYLSFDVMGIRGYSMGIDNVDDKFKFQNNWAFNNSSTPVITITTDARVGIGTASPIAALHVASFASQTINDYGYLAWNGTVGRSQVQQTLNYSIVANERIRAGEFNAISDIRIKKDILKLNTSNQLAELNKLRPVNYAYIDQLVNGNAQKTGFIAQEVEQVNPQFVNQSTDFIPSVFALAKSATVDKDQLMLSTEKPHGFAAGDVVKFYAEGKKEVVTTVETIIDLHAFTISGWRDPIKNLFIYGKKVNDFRAIDFDQITALSVAAIQELSKQMEKLMLENEKLELNQKKLDQRMKKLESKLK